MLYIPSSKSPNVFAFCHAMLNARNINNDEWIHKIGSYACRSPFFAAMLDIAVFSDDLLRDTPHPDILTIQSMSFLQRMAKAQKDPIMKEVFTKGVVEGLRLWLFRADKIRQSVLNKEITSELKDQLCEQYQMPPAELEVYLTKIYETSLDDTYIIAITQSYIAQREACKQHLLTCWQADPETQFDQSYEDDSLTELEGEFAVTGQLSAAEHLSKKKKEEFYSLALAYGHLDAFDKIEDKGLAFTAAADNGNHRIVMTILERCPNLDTKYILSALECAAVSGHQEILDLLVNEYPEMAEEIAEDIVNENPEAHSLIIASLENYQAGQLSTMCTTSTHKRPRDEDGDDDQQDTFRRRMR